jgi:hypothetical protein
MIKVRSSSCALLFSGKRGGLTTKQKEKLEVLKMKIKLTEKQAEERDELEKKGEMSDELSEMAKTYIEDMVDEVVYGFRKKFTTREMTKGIMVEDDSIEMYNRLFFTSHFKQAEFDKFYELTHGVSIGHPDIVDESRLMVIDIKSPWSKHTMPKTIKKADKKSKEAGYDWQVKHYLYMLRKMTNMDWRNGEIAYVLSNTPEELIPENEADSLHYMDDLADELRVTIVKVDLTDDDIEWMESQIKKAETYAKEYFNYLNNKNK